MATRRSDTDGEIGLPTPVVEDLLSDATRRTALSLLAEAGEPMPVGTLAAEVVAAQGGDTPDEVDAADREAMREELFTEHIPKLTATGVVTYDSMLGAVELAREGIVEAERTTEFR
jgi:DNA-binding transcriptional ArsR family regulator